MKLSHKELDKVRQSHNKEIIDRMRKGESLTKFDSYASWYPPRPIIQKNKEDLIRIYDGEEKTFAMTPTSVDTYKTSKRQQNNHLVLVKSV